MQYAEVINDKVMRILASSEPINGCVKLPEDHQLLKGDDVRFFDETYKRITPEHAVSKKLITLGEKKKAVWDHGWTVKDDYTKEKYWKKEDGQPVMFEVGDKPDETVTDIEPIDYEAVWENDKWILPPEVEEKRTKEKAQNDLYQLDQASIRAMREVLTAMLEGKEPPVESKDFLLQRESAAKEKREVLK